MAHESETVERLLNVDEGAGVLGIANRTIRALIAAGSLRCVRIGRRVLIDPADIRRFIAQRKARGPR